MADYIKKRGQCDDRWRNVTLGTTPYTVCQIGCVITSISNASGGGTNSHPDKLAKQLQFNSGGNILWDSIDDYKELKLTFRGRYYGMDDREVRDMLNKENRRVIMEVPFGGATNHWCVVKHYSKSKDDFKLWDPLSNKYTYAKRDYGGYLGYAQLRKT